MWCVWTSLFLLLTTTFASFSSAGLLPGVSLFKVVWGQSETLAESILHSSSVLTGLQSGHLTERCYANFLQQEALYLHSVSSTLEAAIGRLQESGDVSSLLRDTLTHYSSRNQSLAPPPSPPPLWLQFSLRSFRSVVLDEPVYWLVALSARASLRSFLVEELLKSRPRPRMTPETVGHALFQGWSKESLKEVTWTRRFKGVLDKHQNNTDAFKAVNIFRDHMTNQKSFYRSVDCEAADEEE